MTHARIILSDEACVLDGIAYSGLPMLIDKRNQIVWPVTDWFRTLATDGNLRGASLLNRAFTIAAFWVFIEKTPTSWDQVCDSTLRRYREHLKRKKGNENATINDTLTAIVAFYIWAQEYGYVFDIIGPTPNGSLSFPIRLISKARGRKPGIRLVTHLLLREERRVRAPIPTQDETEGLFAELSSHTDPYIGRRDYLICKLAAGSGLRRMEALDLKCSMLPLREFLESLLEKDAICWILIIGKGGHERMVPVLPEILLELHDFVESERNDLVREKGFSGVDEIFISANTGKRVDAAHISRKISTAFKLVLSERYSPMLRRLRLHRLRARFVSKLIQTLKADEEAKTGVALVNDNVVLERAATIIGHASIETLRYYLDSHLDMTADSTSVASRRSLGAAAPSAQARR